MSHMSELARQHDEARDLSGIDLVECELSHFKDLCADMKAELAFAEWGTPEHGAQMFSEFIEKYHTRLAVLLAEGK